MTHPITYVLVFVLGLATGGAIHALIERFNEGQ